MKLLKSDNNPLGALDVSHNTALETLRCNYNQLTALNVSNNTTLTELECYNNMLTALDLSNNTHLTQLYCYNNQINSENMATLVASLPTVAGNNGTFRVIDLDSGTEQNVITTTQVATARGKNWTVYGRKNYNWTEYDGVILIDSINFPDANFRNYLLSQSYGSDAMLTSAEIAGIIIISATYMNISDLTGIEYFTALERLYCNGNHLTMLDMSHNTALTTLECSSNQLTTLDVSNNTALKTLDCGSNPLGTIDVSSNTALKTLDCGNNQLTTLDVSHNTALITLKCYYNQLTTLDISQNTALESLLCYINQLTTLDISQNTLLSLLSCYSNQLTALDVSHNTALTTLECYNNQIYGDNMAALVASLPTVAGNSGTFHVINLDSETEQNVITTTQVATARGKNWRVLGKVNGSWQEYDGSIEGLPIIAAYFPDANFRNYLLSTYYGDDRVLTPEEIAYFTQIDLQYRNIADLTGIEHFTALKQLTCNNNQLTTLDVSGCTALETLFCYNNPMTMLDASGCTALERLDCYDNQLTTLDVSGCTALTNIYCHNNQLTTLDVSHRTALIKLCALNNQLTSLNVSGCTALSQLYCQTNQLTSLDVSGCTALIDLECENNQINGENMAALVASLPTVDVENNWGSNGYFYVIDLDSETEQNVITTTQVATARGKNWTVLGKLNGYWPNYNGSEPVNPVISGDANGDGIVNINDITVVVAKVSGGNPQPFVEAAADLDGDGIISVTDITALVRIVMRE